MNITFNNDIAELQIPLDLEGVNPASAAGTPEESGLLRVVVSLRKMPCETIHSGNLPE